MSRPQLEDGYTRIANGLLEAVCRTPMPDNSRRVWFAVLRLTYGYHKKEDTIAYSQISELTGMKRPNVIFEMKRLAEAGMLVCTRILDGMHPHTRKPAKWAIQKDFSAWQPIKKRDAPSMHPHTSDGMHPHTLQRKGKKTTKTSLVPTPQEAVSAAEDLAALVLRNNPDHSHLLNGKRDKTVASWARDLDLMHRRDGRSWEQIGYLIRWTQEDPFWKANILSGKKLREKADTIIARIRADRSKPAPKSRVESAYEGALKLLGVEEEHHEEGTRSIPGGRAVGMLPDGAGARRL